MTTISHEEWEAQALALFGEISLDWAFKCPACGTVSTCRDFKNLGADPQRAACECIGRVDGASDGSCDWCAFGLIRGPVIVTMDDGTKVAAFEFGPGTIDRDGEVAS